MNSNLLVGLKVSWKCFRSLQFCFVFIKWLLRSSSKVIRFSETKQNANKCFKLSLKSMWLDTGIVNSEERLERAAGNTSKQVGKPNRTSPNSIPWFYLSKIRFREMNKIQVVIFCRIFRISLVFRLWEHRQKRINAWIENQKWTEKVQESWSVGNVNHVTKQIAYCGVG